MRNKQHLLAQVINSKLNKNVLAILKDEGFIEDYKAIEGDDKLILSYIKI